VIPFPNSEVDKKPPFADGSLWEDPICESRGFGRQLLNLRKSPDRLNRCQAFFFGLKKNDWRESIWKVKRYFLLSTEVVIIIVFTSLQQIENFSSLNWANSCRVIN